VKIINTGVINPFFTLEQIKIYGINFNLISLNLKPSRQILTKKKLCNKTKDLRISTSLHPKTFRIENK